MNAVATAATTKTIPVVNIGRIISSATGLELPARLWAVDSDLDWSLVAAKLTSPFRVFVLSLPP